MGCQLSVVGYQLWVVSCGLLVVGCQLWVVGYMFNDKSLIT